MVEPYALKEFKNRWYIMAKDSKDHHIKSFGLDPLTNLEITKATFVFPNNYNIEENYRYCFEITSAGEEKPKDIILAFDPLQGKYIKTLPLHHSQQVLLDNKTVLQIKLQLCITHDFIMELLSYGDSMKVMKPLSLIDQIRDAHKNAFSQY